MVGCVGGLAVGVSAWLRRLFQAEYADVAEPALDALLMYVYHAGRAEALESAARALRGAGMHEAADALYAALEAVRSELSLAARMLGEYDHVAGEIARYLALGKRSGREVAPVVGGDGRG